MASIIPHDQLNIVQLVKEAQQFLRLQPAEAVDELAEVVVEPAEVVHDRHTGTR